MLRFWQNESFFYFWTVAWCAFAAWGLIHGYSPTLADIFFYAWAVFCVWLFVWATYWQLAKLIGRRLKFYFAWFSFLRQRRQVIRFQALADRLWRRNQARERLNRNILPGS